MKKSIYLKKPVMVEGKIISEGAKILVESEDIEDVGVVETDEAPALDTLALRRARRIAKIRAMKRAEAEVVDADENDTPVNFPADEIQALRRARKLRAMKLAKLRQAKKAEDEIEDITEEDDIEERKARLARIRKLRQIKTRYAKRAEDELEEEGDDGKTVDALRRARLARIRRLRAMKKAEEDKTLNEEDDENSVVAEKCGK